jgi:TonB family protein
MSALRNAVILVCACALLAAASAQFALGGVAVGASILDVMKSLGQPDTVQTRDDGLFWQWVDRDGLDREVMTTDDLIVTSVLIAQTKPGSSAQPHELPVLGMRVADAAKAVEALGATPVPQRFTNERGWRLDGSVLVEEADGDAVVRVHALDDASARRLGIAGDPLPARRHTAPVLVKPALSPTNPPGVGQVIVLVHVDERGAVTDTRVLSSSGSADIDRFEVDGLRRSTFAPATCDGTPCAGVYLDVGGML